MQSLTQLTEHKEFCSTRQNDTDFRIEIFAVFVVTFIGFLSLVLVLAPLLWSSVREVDELKVELRSAHDLVAQTIRQADHYKIGCETSFDGLVIQDMRGNVIWANPAYCQMLGYSLDELIGRNPLSFALPPEDTPSPEEIESFRFDPEDPIYAALKLYPNQHRNGTRFWNQLSVSFKRTADGRENAILVCRDVSKEIARTHSLQNAQRQLQIEATHDSLTGMPNRRAIMDYLEGAVAGPHSANVGVLHVDLDHLKDINVIHGHSAGDAILTHTARELKSSVGPNDLVARIGGDEFLVVFPRARTLDRLRAQAGEVLGAFKAPLEWNGRFIASHASIGAALNGPKTRM